MNEELIKKLTSLAHLDRDAVGVYGEALKHSTESDVTEQFKEFRDEHENHATQLSAAIVKLGGPAPELNVDAMGVVAEWVVSFRSMLGSKGPLHAMRLAEKYHNSRYHEATTWAVDDHELAGMLARFYGDEQRHLNYIDARLSVHAAPTS